MAFSLKVDGHPAASFFFFVFWLPSKRQLPNRRHTLFGLAVTVTYRSQGAASLNAGRKRQFQEDCLEEIGPVYPSNRNNKGTAAATAEVK